MQLNTVKNNPWLMPFLWFLQRGLAWVLNGMTFPHLISWRFCRFLDDDRFVDVFICFHHEYSGKRLHNELDNHHAVNGKTHYFYCHFQWLCQITRWQCGCTNKWSPSHQQKYIGCMVTIPKWVVYDGFSHIGSSIGQIVSNVSKAPEVLTTLWGWHSNNKLSPAHHKWVV